MVLTSTKSISLGFSAPNFRLLEPINNRLVSLDDIKSEKGTLIVFMCNHCPYVIHVLPELVKIALDYISQGISFIAINSNDIILYPDDSPEKMCDLVKNYNIPFPYLFDDTQEIAKLYSAECTPDFNIFDGNMKCVYRGQIDSSRPGNKIPLSGLDIRRALDSLLLNKKILGDQTPSVGCNIKWK